jgi:hypothetical protein
VTFAQVRGARDPYWGSMVSGPEMPAPLCPATSPPAVLHPSGVKSVRTKKHSAMGRTPVYEIDNVSPIESLGKICAMEVQSLEAAQPPNRKAARKQANSNAPSEE